MAKERNEKDVMEIVESHGYVYISTYIKNRLRHVVIKDNLGYKYDVHLNNITRGYGMSFVDKGNPFTLSDNIPLWLKLNNSQFELLEDNKYERNTKKLKFYCHKCKDYPLMSWDSLLHGYGCGVCHGFQVGLYHNLETQRPDIAAEWHPIKNGKLTPRDVTSACDKKVWWLCPNGHDYFSRIAGRTKDGKGCKLCSDERKESKLATELKSYILNKHDAEKEYSIFKNPETGYPLPFDVYIFGGESPEINGIYIEIHGEQHYKFIPYWHKTNKNFEYQKYKDKIKRNFAKKNGAYIEIDLRKVKTTQQAIKLIEEIIGESYG